MILLYLCNNEKPVSVRDELDKCNEHKDLFLLDRKESLVSIGSYVLMPNHFHILIKEVNEGGISLFMQKLSTAYSMYFNKKYNRTGGLFEGKYKAKHAESDDYLKYLFSYIHLNPVKLIEPAWKETGISNRKDAKEYLRDYTYSSYQDYVCEGRVESSILTPEEFPEYFKEKSSFGSTIDDWLNHSE
jgi:putative transposase